MAVRALLVGAGAVGQVYGRHLALGGAEVSFFVREKYAEEMRRGVQVYPLNRKKRERWTPVEFADYGVVTTVDEVREGGFDQVWLCVSATALRGDWLGELLAAAGEAATVVLLQPGLEDRDFLLERVAEERLVQGVISLISYQAPLPVQADEIAVPGVAYWFPPMGPSPFFGERAQEVVSALKAGRCPATISRRGVRSAAGMSAVLMPHLVALEGAGWSFSGLRKSGYLADAAAASKQALGVVKARKGVGTRMLGLLARPFAMKMLLRVAPKVVPLPLEPYFEYHFTKTGDQTRFMLEEYAANGRAAGLPVDAIERLQRLEGRQA